MQGGLQRGLCASRAHKGKGDARGRLSVEVRLISVIIDGFLVVYFYRAYYTIFPASADRSEGWKLEKNKESSEGSPRLRTGPMHRKEEDAAGIHR